MDCNTEGFSFQYVPSKDLEKVVKKVQNDRKAKESYWGNLCLTTGSNEDKIEFQDAQGSDFQILSKNEIENILDNGNGGSLFGPSRKVVVTRRPAPDTKEAPRELEPEPENIPSIHIVEELEDDQKTLDGMEDSNFFEAEDPENSINVFDSEEKFEELPTEMGIEVVRKTSDPEKENIIYYGEVDNQIYEEDFALGEPVFSSQEEKRIAQILKKAEDEESYVDENFKFLFQDENQVQDDSMQHLFPKIEIRKKTSQNTSEFGSQVQIMRADGDGDQVKPSILEKSVRINLQEDQQKYFKEHQENPGDGNPIGKSPSKTETGVSLQDEMLCVLERITSFQKKTCESLDGLRETVKVEPFIEDEIDLRKRKKRSAEFTNRFARNYLYQIGRIADDIRHQPKSETDLSSKVYTLYQIIMQATQTYQKNIEYFTYTLYPEKLEVLVDFIINATKICLDKNVFDRRDSIIQKMMRKCLKLKDQLVGNLDRAPPRPAPKKIQKAKSNPKINVFDPSRGPLSMYEAQRKRSNPFLKSYQSPYSGQVLVKQTPSKHSLGRRGGRNDKRESVDLKFITEAVQNIAEEKISELLLPLVSSLKKNQASESFCPGDSDKSTSEEIPLQRVTASPEVKRITPPQNSLSESPDKSEESEMNQEAKSTIQKVEKVAKNVQITLVKSNEDSSEAPKNLKVKKSGSKIPTKKSLSKEKVNAKKLLKAKYEEAKQLALQERNSFIESLSENPLYVNDFFPKPWREMSNISDQLLVEAIEEVCKEIDFGEADFLEDFLKQELTI